MMNVIRFNWPFVTKVFVLLALAYSCLFLALLLIQPREPSLKYDKARGHFLLRSAAGKSGENDDAAMADVREQFRRQRQQQQNENWWSLLSDDEDFRSFKFKHGETRTTASSDYEEQFFQIKSVSMTYAKMAPETWVDQVDRAVKLGANTVQVDIPWSVHERTPGDIEFTVLAQDVRTFIEIIDHYGLYVLVRFDPYLYCSDYDFGGLPSWLLFDKRLKEPGADYKLLDLGNAVFFDEYKKYLNSLLPIITNLQFSRGGPIIGVLVQNFATSRQPGQPFGLEAFYNADYYGFVDDMLRSFEFDEAILVLDPYNQHLGTFLPFEESLELHDKQVLACPDTSVRQYWNVNKTSLDFSPYQLAIEKGAKLNNFESSLKRLLLAGRSFNIDKFVCSTNYGFLAGTHHDHKSGGVLPLSTSMVNSEFECLIDENGHLTDKYWRARDLFARRLGLGIGRERKEHRVKEHEHVYGVLDKYLNLNDLFQLEMSHYLPFQVIAANLNSPVRPNELSGGSGKSDGLHYMEYLSRHFNVKTPNQGYILYRLAANLPEGATIYLKPESIRDYAVIVCDATKRLATINSINQSLDEIIFIKLDARCERLEILVENMGRASNLNDLRELAKQRKGLLSKDAITFVRDSVTKKVEKMGDQVKLEVFFLDFDPIFYNRFSFNSEWLAASDKLTSHSAPFMAYFKFQVHNSSATNFKKVISSQMSSGSGPQAGAGGQQVNYSLQLDKSTSVYLLLSNYKKGVAFLNGFNLGRYWTEVGPLCTLYLPDYLLVKGLNELVIFELNKNDVENTSVYFSSHHVLQKNLK